MPPHSPTAGARAPRRTLFAFPNKTRRAMPPRTDAALIGAALIGAALAWPGAAAAEGFDMTLGGFMTQWIGYASTDAGGGEDVSGFDTQADAEIHFIAHTNLDNGLKVGVQVQLEAETSDDQIDEAFLFLRGDFGELLLGSEDGAAYAMHYGVASQGIGLDDGEAGNWILGVSAELFTTATFFFRDDDANKVRYLSPRVAGFQFGVSYAPEGVEDDDAFPTEAKNDGTTAEQIVQAAVNYEHTFGDLSVAASLGTEVFGDTNGTSGQGAYIVASGLELGYGPFGASFAVSYENEPTVGFEERTVAGGSVFYASGPTGVSLALIYGTADATGGGDDADQVSVELGGHYDLGPGVSAQASVYYVDYDAGTGGRDSSGFAAVGGITLAF